MNTIQEKQKSKYLITGSGSGLGRFLYEYFGGIGFDRNTSPSKFEQLREEGFDVIIHCASQPPRTVSLRSLYPFIDDNVLLTQRVAETPHKKFIFISSVDVYPKTLGTHNEDEEIPIEGATSFYVTTKLMSESIVRETSSNFLILRCSALLGTYSRPNSLIRIAEERNPKISLSESSIMNYVRHKQIAEFIEHAIKNNLSGIYNTVSSKNINMRQVAKLLEKKVNFGSYNYNVGGITNRKVSKVFPSFKKTSEDIVREFMTEDFPKRKI